MLHPGEDNICLARTHQQLVRYAGPDEDTYVTVVETLAENLSRTVQSEIKEQGKQNESQAAKSATMSFLESPPQSAQGGTHRVWDMLAVEGSRRA